MYPVLFVSKEFYVETRMSELETMYSAASGLKLRKNFTFVLDNTKHNLFVVMFVCS